MQKEQKVEGEWAEFSYLSDYLSEIIANPIQENNYINIFSSVHVSAAVPRLYITIL